MVPSNIPQDMIGSAATPAASHLFSQHKWYHTNCSWQRTVTESACTPRAANCGVIPMWPTQVIRHRWLQEIRLSDEVPTVNSGSALGGAVCQWFPGTHNDGWMHHLQPIPIWKDTPVEH
jgi:hypothetical protein